MFARGFPGEAEQAVDLRVAADRGEEAVAEPSGPAGGRVAVAADMDRHARLGRPGPQDAVAEVGELAMMARALLAPECAHRGDVVVGACAAALERDAERAEFLGKPADADAEDQAAAGEAVECRRLLGEHQRVALRQDDHARRQAKRRRVRGDPGEPDERIGDRRALAAGHPPRWVVGIAGLVAGRHDDVLDRPQRFEAGALRRTREGRRDLRLREWTDVRERDAELHGHLSRRRTFSRRVRAATASRRPAAPQERSRRSPRRPRRRRSRGRRGRRYR